MNVGIFHTPFEHIEALYPEILRALDEILSNREENSNQDGEDSDADIEVHFSHGDNSNGTKTDLEINLDINATEDESLKYKLSAWKLQIQHANRKISK